jgi:hypothetical protein
VLFGLVLTLVLTPVEVLLVVGVLVLLVVGVLVLLVEGTEKLILAARYDGIDLGVKCFEVRGVHGFVFARSMGCGPGSLGPMLWADHDGGVTRAVSPICEHSPNRPWKPLG